MHRQQKCAVHAPQIHSQKREISVSGQTGKRLDSHTGRDTRAVGDTHTTHCQCGWAPASSMASGEPPSHTDNTTPMDAHNTHKNTHIHPSIHQFPGQMHTE
mmetsp:Transcript_51199/g.128566  ORF Transcript_51199/g.128566 Transcript_51199/m.128566 type:complete len:101 (-) Transcript_51199:451-753(-)